MFVDVMIFLGICSDSTFWQPYFFPLTPPPKKKADSFQKTFVGNFFSVFTGEEQICCFVGERFLDK